MFNDFRNEMMLLEMQGEGEESQLNVVQRAIHNRNYTAYDFHASVGIIGSRFVTLLNESDGDAGKAIRKLKTDIGLLQPE